MVIAQGTRRNTTEGTRVTSQLTRAGTTKPPRIRRLRTGLFQHTAPTELTHFPSAQARDYFSGTPAGLFLGIPVPPSSAEVGSHPHTEGVP